MKDFFKRVLFSNVSEHASSTTVSANSTKFLTSDILKTFKVKRYVCFEVTINIIAKASWTA